MPEGEMESFCPTAVGDGIKWVEQVLKKDLSNDPELSAARSFAKQVATKLAIAIAVSKLRSRPTTHPIVTKPYFARFRRILPEWSRNTVV